MEFEVIFVDLCKQIAGDSPSSVTACGGATFPREGEGFWREAEVCGK